MTSFWNSCQGDQLEQGDYLPGCWIPVVGADFNPAIAEPEISVGRSNLAIVTQSCDLANEKIQLAALCPVADLASWERLNADYAKRGFGEGVRQGRREGLHMLERLRRCRRRPEGSRGRFSADLQFACCLPAKARLKPRPALAFAIAVSRAFFASLRPLFYASRAANRDSCVQVTQKAAHLTWAFFVCVRRKNIFLLQYGPLYGFTQQGLGDGLR